MIDREIKNNKYIYTHVYMYVLYLYTILTPLSVNNIDNFMQQKT